MNTNEMINYCMEHPDNNVQQVTRFLIESASNTQQTLISYLKDINRTCIITPTNEEGKHVQDSLIKFLEFMETTEIEVNILRETLEND